MLGALRRLGLQDSVQVVNDGEECLAYLRRRGRFAEVTPGNPKVLLLDLNMPKIGGPEILRELRSTPSLTSIPVVIMTSSHNRQDILESYCLGANACLLKPDDVDSFMDVIERLWNFWGVLNEPPPGSVSHASV